jgi:hypothetical protein
VTVALSDAAARKLWWAVTAAWVMTTKMVTRSNMKRSARRR